MRQVILYSAATLLILSSHFALHNMLPPVIVANISNLIHIEESILFPIAYGLGLFLTIFHLYIYLDRVVSRLMVQRTLRKVEKERVQPK